MARRNSSMSVGAFGLGLVVVVAGLVFVVLRIRRQWDEVRTLIGAANWVLLAVAVLGGVITMVAIAVRWHRCMRMLGATPHVRDSVVWFGSGQLGKYVPGGIWHVVGQGELARRGGIPRPVSYTSVLFASVSLMGAGALITAVGAIAPSGIRPTWWVVPAGLALTAFTWEPRIFTKLATRLGMSVAPKRRHLIEFGVGNLVPWAGVAATTVLCAWSIDSDVAVIAVALAAVGSWLIGFLALPAPGGLGVREAAFVLLLEGHVDATLATSIALVSRAVFLVADLGLFAAVVGRSRAAVGGTGTHIGTIEAR